MKVTIKHKKKKVVYVVEISETDMKETRWDKKDLKLLKEKNSSKHISDIIYGLQIQARNIESTPGYSTSKKRSRLGGRTLLRSRR